MDRLFITNLTIGKVRHLENIQIPLSEEQMKHLIITGKNGSGKTSVLDAVAHYMNSAAINNELAQNSKFLKMAIYNLENAKKRNASENDIFEMEKSILNYQNREEEAKQGIAEIELNYPLDSIYAAFEKGEFILAYYKADRVFQTDMPKHVEKVELKDNYAIQESPRKNFVKYLLDLKVTEALARSNGKSDKADKISEWFGKFQDLLRKIFEDDTLKLEFDEDSYAFNIHEKGKEPFDFNTLSSGYAAMLDIVVDIIIRMEKKTNRTFRFDMPGIVLIDEIETHLHLELQKNILKLLTTVFPNIQFVVSTHSPFILNSLENVVIYDLENHLLVENGLADVPYDGIVEGYFQANMMSDLLKEKFEKYRSLVQKKELTDEDFEEIARLEMFLNEIPDYLALGITTEYQRLKLEFESREDI